LSKPSGQLFGPVEDKHAAHKLVQIVEDAFDLCRYFNILVESPNAKSCAYKEMGKCPAPCDGSISLEQYRQLVHFSTRSLRELPELIREQEKRMQDAAAELRFETAAKIKQFTDQLKQLGKGALRFVRPINEFNFVTVQRGPRSATAKVFLITPGGIEEILGLLGDAINAGQVLRVALERAAESEKRSIDATGAERLGVATHHLFPGKNAGGTFLRLETLDEKSVTKAYQDLRKQPEPEPVEGEGVLKELQSL
jgi:hypothetical protein